MNRFSEFFRNFRGRHGFNAVASVSLLLLAGNLSQPFISSAHSCEASGPIKIYHSSTTSAGFLTNLLKQPGSLMGETNTVITQGLERVRRKRQDCGSGLPSHGILVAAVPGRFLANYGEKRRCESLLNQTSVKPLRFQGQRFPDVDTLVEWFSAFSQGSGQAGRQLYRQCPGLCSPRYLMALQNGPGNLQADFFVVCGPARDKSDNTYKLRAGIGPLSGITASNWLR